MCVCARVWRDVSVVELVESGEEAYGMKNALDALLSARLHRSCPSSPFAAQQQPSNGHLFLSFPPPSQLLAREEEVKKRAESNKERYAGPTYRFRSSAKELGGAVTLTLLHMEEVPEEVAAASAPPYPPK